ncbi:hypothetical protein BuS5_02515 [Desulfosarcina sp. BuS5]|uniref:FecR domain-containing protein n=1 Tax=Desulfosarcina sp. BuS5 TaxID=933262 RepID=UPI0005542BDC|nr:FecR domain-containing protein [Desulfosarcina sp. BuS5]WDN89547.1 hypothetical protein BuS5_02515 [Desulfosarcina sp. BuS5]
MKKLPLYFQRLTTLIGILMVFYLPVNVSAQNDEKWVAKVVSVQGSVLSRRVGEDNWVKVRLNDTYGFGDMLKVQEKSRAGIMLCNDIILRLDQRTTITLLESEKGDSTSLIELLKGAAHFFSRSLQQLRVNTPFVNAAVDGTEFFIKVEEEQTLLSVFAGQVSATNKKGRLLLADGQSAIAMAGHSPVLRMYLHPRDAVRWVLYYPAILYYHPADFTNGVDNGWQAMVRESIEFYRAGDLEKAFSSLTKVPDDISDPRYYNYLAGLLLTVGRVDEASFNIEKALSIDSGNSYSFLLKSIIALAQNQKDTALGLARKSVELDPGSSPALIALSFTEQAHFKLQSALNSIKKAIQLDPENGQSWSRLSELRLSVGDIDGALDAAREAMLLNPDQTRTQTVWGFACLAMINIKDAKKAFKKAIRLDQAAPLPRLGLGLAKIREGDLKGGRREIEIATSLDPNNSLIRSYMGKAYYEEKRNKLAMRQLSIAKKLDPGDPTPYFYDAIQKQTMNRPVEALQDLQKSIELNDNRAVYRSRLLLDQDLAARSAGLARIYNDLGFQQLALVEGWKSLNTDPGNYSAHRFLADSYSALPRHEIARSSEILQSQLLQPVNITPVPPQLAEAGLQILEGTGPAAPSFNEFMPLFNRNRFSLQASGVTGKNNTLGDETILSGVWGKGSYSIGRFHYKTDGFRQNNDLKQEIYNAFIQARINHKTSVQAELRNTETENGDLGLRFDPAFSNDFHEEQRVKILRLGFKHTLSPRSDFVGSFIYQDLDHDQNDHYPSAKFTGYDYDAEKRWDGYNFELQYLFKSARFKLTSGIGHIEQDFKDKIMVDLLPWIIEPPPLPPPLPPLPPFEFDPPPSIKEEDDVFRRTNIYTYSQINLCPELTLTAGLSADFLERGEQVERDQLNPKIGLTWQLFQATTIRMAAFRELGSWEYMDQTIEPTQVAGFNQFYDDNNGTDSWRYGAAVDHKFSLDIFGGIEYAERKLKVPLLIDPDTNANRFDWKEEFGRGYLYWALNPLLALSAEYQYERFDRKTDEFRLGILDAKTHRIPLGFYFFHPSGITARFKGTYFRQTGKFKQHNSDAVFNGKDRFWVFDTAVSYRLPRRLGLFRLGIKNLFDKKFNFQDTDPLNPMIIPERFIFVKLSLTF